MQSADIAMKRLVTAMVLFLSPLVPAHAQPPHSSSVRAQGSHICLREGHIQNRVIPDDRTIIFRMDDGTAWKTTLQTACAGLHISDRFSFVDPQQWICGGHQRIRVTGGAGGFCFLGELEKTVYPTPAYAGH